MRGVGSWFVEAPGVGGVRNGLIELLLPDPLSEEISGHLLVRDMLHVHLAGELLRLHLLLRQRPATCHPVGPCGGGSGGESPGDWVDMSRC